MPVLLNAADRPLFLGSRPTPFARRRRLPGAPGAASLAPRPWQATQPPPRRIELSPARSGADARRRSAPLDLPRRHDRRAVRLTGSGLGCGHWPALRLGHAVARAKGYHAFIEFGNRVIGAITIVLALLTAARRASHAGPVAARAAAGARDLHRHARAGAARRPHRDPRAQPAARDDALPARAGAARRGGRRRGRGARAAGRAAPSRLVPLELRRGALVVLAGGGAGAAS